MHFALGIKTPLRVQPIQHRVGTYMQRTECRQMGFKLFFSLPANFVQDKAINPSYLVYFLLLSPYAERGKSNLRG